LPSIDDEVGHAGTHRVGDDLGHPGAGEFGGQQAERAGERLVHVHVHVGEGGVDASARPAVPCSRWRSRASAAWWACPLDERHPRFRCPGAHERHPCRIDPELHLYVLPAVSCHDHSAAIANSEGQTGHSQGIRWTKWTNGLTSWTNHKPRQPLSAAARTTDDGGMVTGVTGWAA
jgi:hypothetical protein